MILKEEVQDIFNKKLLERLDSQIKPSTPYNIKLRKHLIGIAEQRFQIMFGLKESSNGKKKKVLSSLNDALYGMSDEYRERVLNEKIDSFFYSQIDQRLMHVSQNYHKFKINLKKHMNMYEESGWNFNILNTSSFEQIEDIFTSINQFGRISRYGKSLTKSYKHLFDPRIVEKGFYNGIDINEQIENFKETFQLFEALYEKDFNRKFVEDNLRKIASFDTPEKLNGALRQIIKSAENSPENIIKDIEEKDLDAEVIYNKDGKLAIKIGDYNASNELGSSQWCIATDEHYYEEYLGRTNEEKWDDDADEEYETYNKGVHVFYYDFNKEESDPNSRIAFTIGANSELVAAHDKEDSDIMSCFNELLSNDHYIEIAKKSMPFCKGVENEGYKELMIVGSSYLNILEQPVSVVLESRNPLHVYRTLIENNKEYISDAESKLMKQYLLDKSLSDYETFGDLTPDEMANDLVWLDKFIDKNFKVDDLTNEDYDDEDYYYDDLGDDEYKIKSEISAGYIINSPEFYEIFKQISKLKQDIIFQQNKDFMYEELKNKTNDIYFKRMYNTTSLNSRYEQISTLKENIITTYAETFINMAERGEINLTDFDKKHLVVSNVCSSLTSSQNIEERFLEYFKNGEINPNKIFYNHELFNENILNGVINILNNNPDLISGHFNNKILQNLSKNDLLLNGLNDKVKENIKTQIRLGDFYIGKTDEYKPNTAFEFPDKMKRLYSLGLLDKELIEQKITTSWGLSINELSIIKQETGMNVKEYILSGVEKPKKSKKLKF